MIKQTTYLFLFLFATLQLTSCLDKSNYAQQLKDEKALIAGYIAKNKINVIDTLTIGTWAENDYYLDKSGVYLHLQKIGDVTDSLEKYNQVVVRYKEYDLTQSSDTVSTWTANDAPNPTTFIYGSTDYTAAPEAFHIAVGYMKYMDAEAKIIVPSKLGFSTFTDDVIPMGYTIKMKFQK